MSTYHKSAEQATAHVQAYRYCLSVKPVSFGARGNFDEAIEADDLTKSYSPHVELWQATQSEQLGDPDRPLAFANRTTFGRNTRPSTKRNSQ